MHVTLSMAVSFNGMVAAKDGSTPWSNDIWKAYIDTVRKERNIVIGHRTYDIMKNEQEFEKLGYPLTIVLSHQSHSENTGVIFVASPKEAIRLLKDRGMKHGIVGGGAKTAASFFEAGLIDEVMLDIEPIIIPDGIPLFAADSMPKLKYRKTRKISNRVMRIHYKVG